MKVFIRLTCVILLFSLLLTGCAPATSGKQEDTPADPIPEEPAPQPKEIKNILMIGNSFCYYFVEELVGLAQAEGMEINVYNLYYAARTLRSHYDRLTTSPTADYSLYKTNSSGRSAVYSKSCTVEMALAHTDWDVITLQEHFNPSKADSYPAAGNNSLTYAKLLFDHLKENNPEATLYFHETWAYEMDYSGGADSMTDLARQEENRKNIHAVSQDIAKMNDVTLIPSGEAWAIARENPLLGQTLCERFKSSEFVNDHYHDGESGGQYLNACVWFEVLFGKSCIGNSYIPKVGGTLPHPLTAEKMTLIQEIAHEAVAAVYGEDYAK